MHPTRLRHAPAHLRSRLTFAASLRCAWAACVALSVLAPCAPAPGASAATGAARPPDPDAIREVAAGKRTEARAAWWGFDPSDSTAAFQAAIASGAKTLVVENMGAPWIVDGIELADDQEIRFEPGTVVQAKRGSFKGSSDALFRASLKRNIRLIGPGATLRMWKCDYDDPTQYRHAEWRHVLSLKSCANVRVEGLTLADSGGDGIYLGVARRGTPCSDIVIKDVKCINNYRQGISVISARRLLIEQCTLCATGGTSPQAGIDFEPNHESEELVDCVMRDCISEDNRGDAYVFYLRPLRAASTPVSVRIENCRALGCRTSARVVTANDGEGAGVRGTIEFVDCAFERSAQAAVAVADKPAQGARVTFARCRIVDPAADRPDITPIVLSSRAGSIGTLGGLRFEQCTVADPIDRRPISYHDLAGGVGLADITGTLTVERGGGRVEHRFTPELVARWMPHKTFRPIPPLDLAGRTYEPALPDAPPVESRTHPQAARRVHARQRGPGEWLLWADAPGRRCTFVVSTRPVGRVEPEPAGVRIVAPSGKPVKPARRSGEGLQAVYEFDAAARGAHKILCDPGRAAVSVHSADSRVCLHGPAGAIHLIGPTCPLFFWVPPGAAEFGLVVSGEGGGEKVKATLCGPGGEEIERRDSILAHQFVARPADPSRGEIWSVRLERPGEGAFEDYHVRPQGVAPVFAEAPGSLLRPAP